MAYLCNDDILSLIFIATLQFYKPSLLTLRSVNRTWCNVAGRTPQLWTRLVLKQTSYPINLEYLEFYLRKSGALPIDVRIALPYWIDVNRIGGVAALLRDHASRFRSFELDVRSHEELEAFISSFGESKPAPFLEKLVLTVQVRLRTKSSSAPEFLPLATTFTPSPRLAHISISGFPFPKTLPPTITSLTINDTNEVDIILSSFESTPSLQNFTFKGYDGSASLYNISPEFKNPDIISLPHLLTAKVSVPGYGAYLLRAIDAPELDYLILDGRDNRIDDQMEFWEIPVLTELFSLTVRHLSVYSRNLRRLTLAYTEFEDPFEDYKLILSGYWFPKLEELTLVELDVDSEAFLAAGNDGGSSSLKELSLRDCWGVTGHGLLGFVRGRRSDFCLSLYRCEYLWQEDIAALSDVVKVHILSSKYEDIHDVL